MKANIDLTEHRDFDHSRLILTDLTDAIRFSNELLESSSMTFGDFEKLSYARRMFGRKGHENGIDRIFNYKERFERKWKDTCVRCGKPIRIPWHEYRDLCKDCNKYMYLDNYGGKHVFPWTPIQRTGRNTIKDLFDSR